MNRLVGTMNDALAFVDDADPLKTVKEHIEPLKLLTFQVKECACFISDYAKHKSYCEVDPLLTGFLVYLIIQGCER